jgi:hypothetical protein
VYRPVLLLGVSCFWVDDVIGFASGVYSNQQVWFACVEHALNTHMFDHTHQIEKIVGKTRKYMNIKFFEIEPVMVDDESA